MIFFSFPSIRLEFTLVSSPSNTWWTIIFHIQCMKACKVHHTIVLKKFSGRYCRMVKELKLLAFGLERHASLLSCTLFFLTNFLIHYYYYCISLQPIISIPVCYTSFFTHRMIIWHYSLIFDEFSLFRDIHVWMNWTCLLSVATHEHTLY